MKHFTCGSLFFSVFLGDLVFSSMSYLSFRYFAMVDKNNGVQIYSYEGRHISNPKFAGIKTEFISRQTLSISTDAVALLDNSENKGNSQ